MSTPHASSPQTALADVEQRIVAAAKEREEASTDAGAQAHKPQVARCSVRHRGGTLAVHDLTARRRRQQPYIALNVSPTSTLPP